MLDVLEVYERPYDAKRPVVCIDEKSKQLIEKTRPDIPGKPGKMRRQDYEYKRNGTVNIFVAVEPKGKKRNVQVTKKRKAIDFGKFIGRLVSRTYQDAEKIVVITDNLNIHGEKSIRKAYEPEEAEHIIKRIEWHYTPKHASWLDQAEIEINALSRQALSEHIETFQKMQHQCASWTKDRNKREIGINWKLTREKAKKKFKLGKYENT
jgi:hypothetical protein